MASPDNQFALSRIHRGLGGNLSRATRQVVPPFLQKLYEMVSDSATDDLIRWSDSGDSFFVLDRERVAQDVLPRWFKHNNFASFVRQLNMYGFHKIPHLQQGVLRSDSETETWNFEHPNFHRGQPDLLCLISRKKQASERGGEDVQPETRETSHPSGSIGANAGTLLDVNSIISGIAAIKRHQTTISADLNDLKTSNQHLWQEAIAARERHKKHQDTINRILKFLAGVFGNSAGSPKGSSNDSSPHPVMSRKRQRLMIENVQQPKSKELDNNLTEVELKSTASSPAENDESTSNRFAVVDTPTSTPTSPLASSNTMPAVGPSSLQYDHILGQPMIPTDILTEAGISPSMLSSASPSASSLASHRQASTQPIGFDPPVANSLAPSSNYSQDTLLQAILQSPTQLQRLMAALTSQLNLPMQPTSELPPDFDALSSPYIQPSPAPGFVDDLANGSLQPVFSPAMDHDTYPMTLMSQQNGDDTNLGPLLDRTSQIQKTYKDTEAVSDDVDTLQASINTFMQNLGLDSDTLHSPNHVEPLSDGDRGFSETNLNPIDLSFSDGDNAKSSAPDFDFDAFLTQFDQRDGDPADGYGDFTAHLDPNTFGEEPPVNASSEQMSAFLDEVHSQSDASSPNISRTVPEEAAAVDTAQKKARKRKSEAMGQPSDLTSGKAKRKR